MLFNSSKIISTIKFLFQNLTEVAWGKVLSGLANYVYTYYLHEERKALLLNTFNRFL